MYVHVCKSVVNMKLDSTAFMWKQSVFITVHFGTLDFYLIMLQGKLQNSLVSCMRGSCLEEKEGTCT